MDIIDSMKYTKYDIELIAKIKLQMCDAHLIFLYQWISSSEKYLDTLQRTSSGVYLIEIHPEHWVTLSWIQDCNHKNTLVYYYDPYGKFLCENIRNFFDSAMYISLKKVHHGKHSPKFSWIYCIYYAFISKENPYPFEVNEKAILHYEEEIIDLLKQINKFKNKVEICCEAFTQANTGYIPVISNFKCANLFLFFLESLAFEDRAFKNQDLINYFINNIVGQENVTKIRNLRSKLLLHRKKMQVIFPQDLHKYVFGGISCRSVFRSLELYLQNVVDKLEGCANDDYIEQPKEILNFTEEVNVGNLVQSLEEVKEICSEYSSNFIESISEGNYNYPEEIMFNFLVNFIPLMHMLYKKQKGILLSFINLRNQLVHNIYILHYISSDLPNVYLLRSLAMMKDELLVIDLNLQLSQVFMNFTECENHIDLDRRLRVCFDSYRIKFLDENNAKCKVTVIDYIDPKFSNEKKYEFLIEIYLKSLPIIDHCNEIDVSHFKVKHLGFSPYCTKVFTDNQRRKIFGNLILLKLSFESHKDELSLLRKVGHEVVVQNVQIDLESSVGLTEGDFKIMYHSIISTKNNQDKTLTRKILGHIVVLQRLISSGIYIDKMLEDYLETMNGGQSKFMLEKELDLQDICIPEKLFVLDQCVEMNIGSIVKNIMTLLHGSSTLSFAIYQTLEEALNHEQLLYLLSKEPLDHNRFIKHIYDLPYLVPFAIVMLYQNKLYLPRYEEGKFLTHCISTLIRKPCSQNYLSKLLELRPNQMTQLLRKYYSIQILNSRSFCNFSAMRRQSKILHLPVPVSKCNLQSSVPRLNLHFLNSLRGVFARFSFSFRLFL